MTDKDSTGNDGPLDDDVELTRAFELDPGDADSKMTPTRVGESTTATAEAAIAPGQRLGPYVIDRWLGGGGMGEVYSAEHLENGHRLAVKLLAASRTWSDPLRQRFLREGELAATINHPNSLYVYGTEVIDGMPLIAMELADGGTLQDRIQNDGPLPVTEAVDAILQVSAGLAAAHTAGVLHRDVKPANCFVGRDGTVKIGDYGLSLQAIDAEETRVTMAGTILGTPAFAPPEQLRGEDVDVRSDIYSVGATLYTLLTGKTPLQASGAMQMLAAVLATPPQSPRTLRQEIPTGLAQVILRCLEKKPADRYQDYPALQKALTEFSSRVCVPAPARTRLGAGAIDYLLYGLLWTVVILGTSTPHTSAWVPVITMLAGLVYALPEMLWGRSPGKAISGLRLVQHGNRKPSSLSVLSRTAVFMSPWTLLSAVFINVSTTTATTLVYSCLNVIALFLLFLPWRRPMTWLGWHDRLSNTRVVVARTDVELVRTPGPELKLLDPDCRYPVGPYLAVADPARCLPGQVLDGFDPVLRRRVWIMVHQPEMPATPASRRNLARQGRLRWLNGRRTADLAWDAYEAPDGQALCDSVSPPPSWTVVRRWLAALAQEIPLIVRTGDDTGMLRTDHVWIKGDGGVVLLDFPAPGVEELSEEHARGLAPADERTALRTFLTQVARRALHGRQDPTPDSAMAPELPLPLHASRILARLSDGRYESSEMLLADLRLVAGRIDRIGRRRRALQFAAPSVITAGMFVSVILVWQFGLRSMEAQRPGYQQAATSLNQLRRLEGGGSRDDQAERRRDLQIYLAGPLRSVVEDTLPVHVMGEEVEVYDRAQRDRIREALLNHPAPSADEVAAASERLDLPGIIRREREEMLMVSLGSLLGPLVYLSPGLVLVGVAARGGLLMSLLGIAVVTASGRPAGRWRVLVRSMITWMPLLIPWFVALTIIIGKISEGRSGPVPRETGILIGQYIGAFGRVTTVVISDLYYVPLVVFVLGVIYAILHPGRGIQDRVAGTYLVPK